MKTTSPNLSSKGSNFEREQYLYLNTRGRRTGQLREIEIWFTERRGRFFVIAEHSTSHWLQNLRAHPGVQVRVGERRFTASARLVSTGSEAQLHQAVAALSRAKYGWGDGQVVELLPEGPAPTRSSGMAT